MKQSIASNAVKLTTSKIITMTISMISAMLLSRFRTLEEYGTYSQLLLVVNLVSTIFMFGLPSSINFFMASADDKKDKQTFLSVYYTLSTILSLIVGLVLVISIQLIISYFNNPLLKNYLYVLALFPWASIIMSSIENVLIAYGKTRTIMVFRVLNSFSLLIIIAIVELFNLGFNSYMILFIFIQFIFALSVYLIVENVSGGIRPTFNVSIVVKVFKFSIPIGLASVIGTLSTELGKLVIGRFFSTEQVAVYTNAAKEMPVTILASSLTAVLMPQLIKLLKQNKTEDAISLWGSSNTISYSVLCFFSIALFVYAPEVISLLYSDKYLSGVTVFRVYSLILLLRFTYFGIILNSIGKTKFILYSSLASLGLNLILNYMFYFLIGFTGPAVATLVSIAAVQIFQLIATSRSICIPFRNLFPWKALFSITVINILMGIIFSHIKKIVHIELYTGEIFESSLLGALWGVVYFLMMFKYIKQEWKRLNGENRNERMIKV